MNSFPKWLVARPSLIVLATGAGLLPELVPTPATPPPAISRSMEVSDGNSLFILGEHGGGGAETVVFANLSPSEWIGTVNFANQDYTITTSLTPGQSTHNSGSGSGAFTMDVYILDWSTFTSTGPHVADVEIAVAPTSDVHSYVFQGVDSTVDPVTGEIRIVRQHRVGNEGVGLTSGSFSLWLDGVLSMSASGATGVVRNLNINESVRLR